MGRIICDTSNNKNKVYLIRVGGGKQQHWTSTKLNKRCSWNIDTFFIVTGIVLILFLKVCYHCPLRLYAFAYKNMAMFSNSLIMVFVIYLHNPNSFIINKSYYVINNNKHTFLSTMRVVVFIFNLIILK